MRYLALFSVGLSCVFVLTDLAMAADIERLEELLRTYDEQPPRVHAWPDLKPSAGTAFRNATGLYIQLDSWPPDNRLTIPRLNSPTKRAYLVGLHEMELKLVPQPTRWEIELPAAPPTETPPVVVLRTVGTPRLPQEFETIKADSRGAFVLPAHRAMTHGTRLRFEPQPHKNTLGYWTEVEDWAQWLIRVDRAAEYELRILQGCGSGQGGSEVTVLVRSSNLDEDGKAESAEQNSIQFKVQETGHFQNFVSRKLGTLSLSEPGVYSVEVRPRRLAAKAVMDVREIRLVPRP